MIINLYSWIFPAAVFAAAGFSNLSSRIKRKRNPERSGRNRIVWFSLNISLSFCFLSGSVFFVNWAALEWSMAYIYFAVLVFSIFYLAFVFRIVVWVPLIFMLTIVMFFFNVYLQDWNVLPVGGIAAKYRILSVDQKGIKAEIDYVNTEPLFFESPGSGLSLGFETLEIDRSLFFIGSDRYYRMIDSSSESKLFDKIVIYLADKTFLLAKEKYLIDIGNEAILNQYRIVINMDEKNITIEN